MLKIYTLSLILLLGLSCVSAIIYYDTLFDPRNEGFTQDVAEHLTTYQACCIGSVTWLENKTMIMIPCGWDAFYFTANFPYTVSNYQQKTVSSYTLGCGSAGPIGNTIFTASQTGFNAHSSTDFSLLPKQPLSGSQYAGRLGLSWQPGTTRVHRVMGETAVPSIIGYYDYQLDVWVTDWFTVPIAYNFIDGISWDFYGRNLYLSGRANVLVEVDADSAAVKRTFNMGRVPDGCAFISTSVGKFVFTANTDGTVSIVNLTDPNPTPTVFAQSSICGYGDLSGVGPDGCWYVSHWTTAGSYNTISKICPPSGQEFDRTSNCDYLNLGAYHTVRYEFVGHTSRIKLYQPSCPGDPRNNYLFLTFSKIDELSGVSPVKSAPIGSLTFPTLNRGDGTNYHFETKQANINPGQNVLTELNLKYFNGDDIINGYYVRYTVIKFDLSLKSAWPFASQSNQLQLTIDIKSPQYTYSLYQVAKGTEVMFSIPNYSPYNQGKVFFPNTVMADGVAKNVDIQVTGGVGSVTVTLKFPYYSTSLVYEPIAALPLLEASDDPFFRGGYPDTSPTLTYTYDPLTTNDPQTTIDPFTTMDPFTTNDPFTTKDPFTTNPPTDSGSGSGTDGSNTNTPTGTNTNTPTGTNTNTPTGTNTNTPTGTNTNTPTGTNTNTPNGTDTNTPTKATESSGGNVFIVFSVLLLFILL